MVVPYCPILSNSAPNGYRQEAKKALVSKTHGVTLTDDIVRAYDDLLTRKDSGVARAETQEKADKVLAQTGKADAGTLKESSASQNALMEMSPEKQELIRRLSDKSLYQQDQEEKHLYIHPERIALARKNKREQAVHAKEADMARRLASHYGVDVFLLSPNVSEGNMLVLKGKNPDGIVDGVFFDEKQPKGKSESSVQKNFRKAAEQADLMYLDLTKSGLSLDEAVQRISDQVAMEGTDYEGFRLVITDGKGLFSEFQINKKELVESSFLGGPGLSSRTQSHGEKLPLGNSTIASNSDSVKPDVLRQGYDYAQNMSNNAVEAYSEGKRPLWKWRKSDISQAVETLAGKDIVSDMDAAEMKESFLERTEWHHVGSAYNKQDFYAISLDKIRNAIGKLPEEELDNYERASVYTLELLTDVMHRQHLGKEEAINWIGRYLHDHKTADGSGIFLYGTYGLTGEVVDELKGVSGELLSWYNFGKGEDVSWLDHVPSGAVEGKDHIVLGQAEPDVLAQAAEANAAPGRADVDKVLAQTVTIEGYGETAKKQSLEFLDKNAGKEFRTLTGEIIRLPSSRRQRRHIWFTSQKNPQKSDLRRNYNYILNLENLIENAKFQNKKKNSKPEKKPGVSNYWYFRVNAEYGGKKVDFGV